MPPPAATQAAARLCSCVMQRQANTNPPHLPRIPTKCRDNGNCTVCSWLKLATNNPASCKMRFTRGRVRELKNGHNSVTIQDWTHVYMNVFHHKDLGNHLLQLCPKVVKHPVYNYNIILALSKPKTQHEFSSWPLDCLRKLDVEILNPLNSVNHMLIKQHISI